LEALIRIVMKAIILPIGNPPSAGMMLMVSLPVGTNKASAQMLFLVWVTLTEHKWVILGECRGNWGPFEKFHIEEGGGKRLRDYFLVVIENIAGART
jgi:hypothetical protein